MSQAFNEKAYILINQFLDALNAMDGKALLSKFGVSQLTLDEIREALDGYFDGRPAIGLAPFEKAFDAKAGAKPPIDLYEMNDPDTWGADCGIWVDGKAVEPILHLELKKDRTGLYLRNKYIGS